ncbi:MAG: 50S ribosome-binding GTPase [Propionibacteriaceae bacterium]|jgi:GTP-binding protein EngB required for normal cell division|nr:50S ribosome-binding GTPase [Propionibacteriaceae bacterium]
MNAAPPVSSLLGTRAAALREAAGYAVGRSSEANVAQALRVTRQVNRRLAFSGEHTVIALAGATGSGKSSLFNALCGTQLAISSVKRPTTGRAMAAVWGQTMPGDLLDWMDIPVRHLMETTPAGLDGLVLLDLPDYDSIVTAHRGEVDRLVAQVDGLIWVVDPQKYADNALYEGYLSRFKAYADVMLVVLNQSDRLAPADLSAARDHLRSLLAAAGLGKAKVFTTSALNGAGIDTLRAEVAALVKSKRLAATRLLHDVESAALLLAADLNRERNRRVSDTSAVRLVAALSSAAGVAQVADAVRLATQTRGTTLTGWPLVSWLGRLRPDPLKRLHLEAFAPAKTAAPGEAGVPTTAALAGRSALQVSDIQQAQVSTALRNLCDDVSRGLNPGWAQAVREASLSHEHTLADELDAAVTTTDLGTSTPVGWWRFVRVVQWLLLTVAAIGLAWLGSAPVTKYFGISPLPLYRWHDIPLPTWLCGGALIGGFLLGILVSFGVRASANHRATAATAALQAAIRTVADTAVLTPVNTELERYARFVAALARALP